jgi:glycosyltransferase involved in cell wall biosynthesis
MHRAGHDIEVFALRRRAPRPAFPLRLAVPPPLAVLPYRWIAPTAAQRIERRFLESLREDDIAYLWPAASLEAHRLLHARGIPVVLEGINTRMASAKRILDAAYESFGIPPAHGITEARITQEEEKYRYASAIFAPSRMVELALQGSPLEKHVLPTSYGVDATRMSPERNYETGNRPLTFVFCGYACVRKGVHHLLDAWKMMPGRHKLQFLGNVEPAISERYRDILASSRVQLVGFVKDVHRWFAKADVFLLPSLEEGDPLVTYEAALHGLPIIASPMGAGRMGDQPGGLMIVDPARIDEVVAAMVAVAESAELRANLGRTARARAIGFDWPLVGASRAAQLQEAFGIASTTA